MILILLLVFHIISTPTSYDYTDEGWRTLSSSESPTTLKISKRLALMMVSWSGATLKITIPGVIESPVSFTSAKLYSLFTFTNDTIVELTYQSQVTFFIAKCPQYGSDTGGNQFLTNAKGNTLSNPKISINRYFSLFGPYNIVCDISVSTQGSLKLNYWDINNKNINLSITKLVNIPSARKSCSFLIDKGWFSASSCSFNATSSFSPTHTTGCNILWDKITENENNYKYNMAYGGYFSGSNSKCKLIDEISTVKYIATISIKVNYSFYIYNQINNEQIVDMFSILKMERSRDEPFNLSIYVKNDLCPKMVKAKEYFINQVGTTSISVSISQIPNECLKVSYKFCAYSSIPPEQYSFTFKHNFGVTNGNSFSYSSTIKFSVELYLSSSPGCNNNTLLNVYEASASFECINLTEDIIPDNCKTCEPGYFLYDNKCVSSCPIGFVGIDGNCEQCESNCNECSINTTNCNNCSDGYYLYEHECLSQCPSGFLGTEGECEECNSFCSNCSISIDNCTSCIENYFLFDNKCFFQCPKGTINIGKECILCDLNCIECMFNVSNCTLCKSNFYLYENKCIETCPNGTFLNSNECNKCESSCKECSIAFDHCDTCVDDLFFYNNSCYSECSDIHNNTHFGKDIINKECRKCLDENCIDCSNDYSNCINCSESSFLVDGKCIVPSLIFTQSFPFTLSLIFSASSLFTHSSKFSSSSVFTMSSEFIQKSISSGLTPFSVFHSASDTNKITNFIPSAFFSDSNKFTVSLINSDSYDFDQSNKLHITPDFNSISIFSESFDITANSNISSPILTSSSFSFTNSNNKTYLVFSSISSIISAYSDGVQFPDVSDSTGIFDSFIYSNFVTRKTNKSKLPMIIGIICAIVALIAISLIIVFIIRKKNKNEKSVSQNLSEIKETSQMTSNEIKFQNNIFVDVDNSDNDLNFWL